MKIWDEAWLDLLKSNRMTPILYKRYVDDSRNLNFPLAEGWRWDGEKFSFDELTFMSDKEKDTIEQDQIRTSQELTKAMNSLVYFLRFTHEDYTQFENNRLPTLDTELWMEDETVRFAFYEKPTVPNRTLQADTALSASSLHASLVQEIVRRMLNCDQRTNIEDRTEYCQSLPKRSSTRDIVWRYVGKY